MNRLHRLLCYSVLVFLVVGCQPGPDSNPVEAYRGTDGVDISFAEESPPNTVYDDQTFFVALDLHNQGATSVNQSFGPIVTQLNTQNLFYLQQESDRDEEMRQELTLEGRSDIRPRGEEASVSFGTFNVSPRERVGELQETSELLQARVCYPYRTVESDTLCIENPLQGRETTDPLCRARTQRYPGNGAPVAITKIENLLIPVGQVEEVIQRERLAFEDGRITGTETVEDSVSEVLQKPVIKLTIRNRGEGRPVTGDDVCEPGSRVVENTVRVGAELGTDDLTCTPEVVRLDNGRGTTRCVSAEGMTTSTNYQSIFTAKLNYTYIDTATKEINIRQRPGFNEG